MRRSTALCFLVLAACSAPPDLSTATPPARDAFDERFTGRTMRFDYFHSGTATEEHVGLDRIRIEGPWAGSRTRLVGDLDLGVYRFRVVSHSP